METTTTPKIAFYVKRSFGEKLNATFDFFKENWKPFLKFATYLLLPLCIIQGLSLNSFMGSYMTIAMGGVADVDLTSFGVMFWVNYGIVILCSAIGGLIVVSLIMALVKLYNEREDRLNGLTLGELRPLLFRNMGRMFLMGIVMLILMLIVTIVISVLLSLTAYTLLLTVPVFFAFLVALSLCLPTYIYEKTGLVAAITKGLRLGFATWGGVFALMFVLGLVTWALNLVIALPWYIVLIVKTLFGFSSDVGTVETPLLYSLLMYVLGVFFIFGCYLVSTFSILGLSYQYAHATEKLDSITVEDDIDNFEKL